MMSSGGDGGGRRGGGGQEFDLNLAPIIDCFTVLITFMLVSASFLSIGILDAGVAAPSSSAPANPNDKPPALLVQVNLDQNQAMELKVSGKLTRSLKLGSVEGKPDYGTLNRELASLKTKYPDTETLVLTAHDDVEYRSVVEAMEKIRKTVPGVLLGGF